jgi:predicted nucleic-acid-binding Zn-ribbon protein
MVRVITGGIAMTEKGCLKCGSRDTGQKEVAMTGTGLSKLCSPQHVYRYLL